MLSRAIPVFVLLIAGCTYVPLLTPYRMDIQQGNVITQEMVARLERGMTRAQVRFTLGTPMVVDPFRADRWDYVYLYIKGGAITEQRHIVVVFKDDRLERIEGDVVPATAGKATTGKPASPPAGGARSAQNAER
jgi:outer membrane protein assembly factor BamE